jgi:hypothetical protein
MRMVANGNDDVERIVLEILECLARMAGDVDTDLCHHGHGQGIQTVLLDTGRMGFDTITGKLSAQSFGHLTAAGIPRAEK